MKVVVSYVSENVPWPQQPSLSPQDLDPGAASLDLRKEAQTHIEHTVNTTGPSEWDWMKNKGFYTPDVQQINYKKKRNVEIKTLYAGRDKNLRQKHRKINSQNSSDKTLQRFGVHPYCTMSVGQFETLLKMLSLHLRRHRVATTLMLNWSYAVPKVACLYFASRLSNNGERQR